MVLSVVSEVLVHPGGESMAKQLISWLQDSVVRLFTSWWTRKKNGAVTGRDQSKIQPALTDTASPHLLPRPHFLQLHHCPIIHWSSSIIYVIYVLVCMYDAHTTACIWKPESSLWAPSFPPCESQGQIQIIGLGGKCLYLPSLAVPSVHIFNPTID